MTVFFNDEDFENFYDKHRKEEAPSQSPISGVLANKWNSKNMQGTAENPNVYILRFLPKKGSSTWLKRVYFHYITDVITGKGSYHICPKTFDSTAYCPDCAVSYKLYGGTKQDKEIAKKYMRQERHVANVFIKSDPRDAKIQQEEMKATGKNKLYEFPKVVYKPLAAELDADNEELGIGKKGVFDPINGYDFILTIGAKAPDANGKVWPDYNIKPARKPSRLAETDEEILEILNNTIDIDEYLEKLKTPLTQMVDVLKNNSVFELIADEFYKKYPDMKENVQRQIEDNGNNPFADLSDLSPKKEEKEGPSNTLEEAQESNSVNSLEDDELLKQLGSLGI